MTERARVEAMEATLVIKSAHLDESLVESVKLNSYWWKHKAKRRTVLKLRRPLVR